MRGDLRAPRRVFSFFFFNDTATTEIYTLSLHDALPISSPTNEESGHIRCGGSMASSLAVRRSNTVDGQRGRDRKSTRLNSSHQIISYAVFCLKKKNTSSHMALASPCPLQVACANVKVHN